uniref:Uncharacterized protein n=2 Tax=Seriola TaxID=8160 RepID=A0A3B4UYD7_SERDU
MCPPTHFSHTTRPLPLLASLSPISLPDKFFPPSHKETTDTGGHWLMSSVLNHPTAEWFYAYFICISLNRGTVNEIMCLSYTCLADDTLYNVCVCLCEK